MLAVVLANLLLLAACAGLEPIEKDETADTATSAGDMRVSPTSLDFGSVDAYQTESRDLTVSNTGQTPFSVVNASFSGSETFSLDAAFQVPTEVAGNGEVLLSVLFIPEGEGSFDGTLALESDMEGAHRVEVGLTGSGIASSNPSGDVSVSPQSLDFGSVDVDGSGVKSFTVTNVGNGDLLMKDLVEGSPTLTCNATQGLPILLGPGEEESVSVTFDPTSLGAFRSTITLVTDDPATRELSIDVEAEVEDLCDVCAPRIQVNTGGKPNSMTFFYFTSLATHQTLPLTMTNTGDEPLVVSNMTVSNDWTCGEFSTDWSGTVTMDPGDSTSFSVTYTATGLGADEPNIHLNTNILHILSNDPATPDYTVELHGSSL